MTRKSVANWMYWLSVNWKFAFGALASVRDEANR